VQIRRDAQPQAFGVGEHRPPKEVYRLLVCNLTKVVDQSHGLVFRQPEFFCMPDQHRLILKRQRHRQRDLKTIFAEKPQQLEGSTVSGT